MKEKQVFLPVPKDTFVTSKMDHIRNRKDPHDEKQMLRNSAPLPALNLQSVFLQRHGEEDEARPFTHRDNLYWGDTIRRMRQFQTRQREALQGAADHLVAQQRSMLFDPDANPDTLRHNRSRDIRSELSRSLPPMALASATTSPRDDNGARNGSSCGPTVSDGSLILSLITPRGPDLRRLEAACRTGPAWLERDKLRATPAPGGKKASRDAASSEEGGEGLSEQERRRKAREEAREKRRKEKEREERIDAAAKILNKQMPEGIAELSSANALIAATANRLRSVAAKEPDVDHSVLLSDARSTLKDAQESLRKMDGTLKLITRSQDEAPKAADFRRRNRLNLAYRDPLAVQNRLLERALTEEVKWRERMTAKAEREAMMWAERRQRRAARRGAHGPRRDHEEENARGKNPHLKELQMKWLGAVATVRFADMLRAVRFNHRLNTLRRRHSAIKIQRVARVKFRLLIKRKAAENIQQWFYRTILRKRWRVLRSQAVEAVKDFLRAVKQSRSVVVEVKRFLVRIRRIQRCIRSFLAMNRETLKAQMAQIDAYERVVIKDLLKQDHEMLYPGTEFRLPRPPEMKQFRLDKGLKEALVRARLKRKRKEFVALSLQHNAKMHLWKEKVQQSNLFREAMSEWFVNKQYDEATVRRLAQKAEAHGQRRDADKRPATSQAEERGALTEESLADIRIPRRPLFLGSDALSEEEMTALLHEGIKKAGHFKLRRVVCPEFRLNGSPTPQPYDADVQRTESAEDERGPMHTHTPQP